MSSGAAPPSSGAEANPSNAPSSFAPPPFAAGFFNSPSRFFQSPVSAQITYGRKRFSPLASVIKQKDIPRAEIHDERRPKPTWSRSVYPSYLQVHEQISPHMFAHELIHTDENVEENGFCRIVRQRRETKVIFPSPENVEKLLNDKSGASNVFFDIYHLSMNLKTSSFWRVVATLVLSQAARIPKPICHMRLFDMTAENMNATFLVPKLIDELKTARETHVIPMLGTGETSTTTPTSNAFLLSYFVQSVPEFEDTRVPVEHEFKMEAMPRTKRVQKVLPHYTVSYIRDESALQSDIVSSFLFNSQFISVLTGSEGGGGDRDDDDDQASGAEIYQFFQVTSVVPDLQVKLANLKRSYAMLVTRPLPEFNRFPTFLLYAIHLLFEKSSRKVIAEMVEHYDHFAPVLADAILNVLEKINNDMPKFLLFLSGRCSFYASRSYLGFLDRKFDSAKQRLSKEKDPIVIKMDSNVKHVYNFLKAYCSVVHSDLKPARLFFELIDSLHGELFINRPFAGALVLIPAMVESFQVIDDNFIHDRHDELTLRARDRFLLKVAEKSVLAEGSESDEFIRGDAPLSMRMFLDYAVAMSTARKEISPQKLTFATYNGCKLMNMINTFSGILQSLQINGDFFALSDLYYEQREFKMDYLGAAADILQGREICGIAKTDDDTFVIRKAQANHFYQISSHYIYVYESPSSPEETSTEKEDTVDTNE